MPRPTTDESERRPAGAIPGPARPNIPPFNSLITSFRRRSSQLFQQFFNTTSASRRASFYQLFFEFKPHSIVQLVHDLDLSLRSAGKVWRSSLDEHDLFQLKLVQFCFFANHLLPVLWYYWFDKNAKFPATISHNLRSGFPKWINHVFSFFAWALLFPVVGKKISLSDLVVEAGKRRSQRASTGSSSSSEENGRRHEQNNHANGLQSSSACNDSAASTTSLLSPVRRSDNLHGVYFAGDETASSASSSDGLSCTSSSTESSSSSSASSSASEVRLSGRTNFGEDGKQQQEPEPQQEEQEVVHNSPHLDLLYPEGAAAAVSSSKVEAERTTSTETGSTSCSSRVVCRHKEQVENATEAPLPLPTLLKTSSETRGPSSSSSLSNGRPPGPGKENAKQLAATTPKTNAVDDELERLRKLRVRFGALTCLSSVLCLVIFRLGGGRRYGLASLRFWNLVHYFGAASYMTTLHLSSVYFWSQTSFYQKWFKSSAVALTVGMSWMTWVKHVLGLELLDEEFRFTNDVLCQNRKFGDRIVRKKLLGMASVSGHSGFTKQLKQLFVAELLTQLAENSLFVSFVAGLRSGLVAK